MEMNIAVFIHIFERNANRFSANLADKSPRVASHCQIKAASISKYSDNLARGGTIS